MVVPEMMAAQIMLDELWNVEGDAHFPRGTRNSGGDGEELSYRGDSHRVTHRGRWFIAAPGPVAEREPTRVARRPVVDLQGAGGACDRVAVRVLGESAHARHTALTRATGAADGGSAHRGVAHATHRSAHRTSLPVNRAGRGCSTRVWVPQGDPTDGTLSAVSWLSNNSSVLRTPHNTVARRRRNLCFHTSRYRSQQLSFT